MLDLQGQLTQAEQHVAQYKSIADSVESNLRDQSEASQQFRLRVEAQIAEMEQGIHMPTICCYFSKLWDLFADSHVCTLP